MAADSSNEYNATDNHALDGLVVNLQVVSPSVGVTRPLLFPSTPASTTIKQLKEKIREALPLRPVDEHQRLIHRGRALMREDDKLIDIFGAEAVSQTSVVLLEPCSFTDLTVSSFKSPTNIRSI
jgi:hypothetical protein